MDALTAAARGLADETVALRRDFHRHPEIAFQETRTAGIIAERLAALGLAVRSGVGRTGVTALLEGARPGPTVLARADIDALPLQEERDSPYRSLVDGAMHACAHDGHAAVLLGVARLLAERRADLNGRVLFVFQPAEEIGQGARAMLDDGALAGLEVARSIGLHLTSSLPTGRIAIHPGPYMAGADIFRFVIRGRGGHAAKPHETIDPVLVAAHVVTGLQALVARERDPVDPAVLSVTSVHGGTAYNIIPEAVELKGTLRTFNEAVREQLRDRAIELVAATAATFRAGSSHDWTHGTPPVINDPDLTARLRPVLASVVGEGGVVARAPLMSGDDMALWLQAAPGCYFHVGAGDPARGLDRPHHHPHFDIDEAALPLAVEVLTRGVLAFLAERPQGGSA
jgi:amidohydrolase